MTDPWEKYLTGDEREKLIRVDETGKFWAVTSPVLDDFARSLAASRALVEAKDIALTDVSQYLTGRARRIARQALALNEEKS